MKSNKLKFKSKRDYFTIFIIISFGIYISYLLLKSNYFAATILVNLFLIFFILRDLFKTILFYDSFLEIVYPIRFFKKKIKIDFDNVIKVYPSYGPNESAIILLYTENSKEKKITFYHSSNEDWKDLKSLLRKNNIKIIEEN